MKNQYSDVSEQWGLSPDIPEFWLHVGLSKFCIFEYQIFEILENQMLAQSGEKFKSWKHCHCKSMQR